MKLIKWTEKKIDQWKKEGRGQGTGPDYLPWLEVQTISSLGLSRRVWSHKIGRNHHLLSDIEYRLFPCLEWSLEVIDIREQYPLDRELTQAVADELGLRHPHYPGSQVPAVMTVDLLATCVRNGKHVNVAFNAKSVDEAEDENSLNKLEIQRATCEYMGVEHHLIFDTNIPKTKAANYGWVRDALPKEGEVEPRPGYFDELCARMENDLAARMPTVSLQAYCSDFDARFGTAQGVGLRLARMLLNKRTLFIDMDTADIPGTPLSKFTLTGSKTQLRVMGAN